MTSRAASRRSAAAGGLAAALLVCLLVSACSTSSTPSPTSSTEGTSTVTTATTLATDSPPVVVPAGAQTDVTIGDASVVLGVVSVRDDTVVLDIREGAGPTAAATLASGQTVAVHGHTVRATAQPKATAYDPATVRFEAVGGTADVTPSVPTATGTAGTPLTLGPTRQGPLDLGGGTTAVMSVVNAGRQALVVGFSIGTGPTAEQGVHHLVSGDVATIGGHPVRVESDGTQVTFTPYA